jgi:SAM-dependent methyltransferase
MLPSGMIVVLLETKLSLVSDAATVLRPGSLRPSGERVGKYEADAHVGITSLLSRVPFSDVWDAYTQVYGYVVPTAELIERLRGYAPLVDFGCGNGYLSYLLRSAGIDVLAIDPEPPDQSGLNKYFQKRHVWTKIYRGDVTALDLCPKRTLLIAWPPPEPEEMASSAIRSYRGKTIVLIGDERNCGGEAMREALREGFNLVERFGLPVFTPAALAWSSDAVRVYEKS